MAHREYNVTPIAELMSVWCKPEEISRALDELMFFYATARMEEGNTGREDAKLMFVIKELRDAFSKV